MSDTVEPSQIISKFVSKEKIILSSISTKLRNTFSNTISSHYRILAQKRMISCLIPDIHSPMSSVCGPLVSRSTWIPSAESRSCASIAKAPSRQPIPQKHQPPAHIPWMSTSNWSTTGLDNVSQLSASNNGLIRRSRSSTMRFCWGYVHRHDRQSPLRHAQHKGEKTYGHRLLQMHQLLRQHGVDRQRRLRDVCAIAGC